MRKIIAILFALTATVVSADNQFSGPSYGQVWFLFPADTHWSYSLLALPIMTDSVELTSLGLTTSYGITWKEYRYGSSKYLIRHNGINFDVVIPLPSNL